MAAAAPWRVLLSWLMDLESLRRRGRFNILFCRVAVAVVGWWNMLPLRVVRKMLVMRRMKRHDVLLQWKSKTHLAHRKSIKHAMPLIPT